MNIDEQIKETKQRLRKLEARKREDLMQSADMHLATKLHELMCPYNHIDQCFGVRADNPHDRWIEIAKAALAWGKNNNLSEEDLIIFARILKGVH